MDDLTIDTTSPLPGTVNYYSQHLIVCSGHSNWSPRIEDEGGFVSTLIQAVKEAEISGVTRVTACDAPSSMGGGTDVLFFPLNVRLVNLTEADIPAVIRLLHGETDLPLKMVPLEKPIWLVCGHEQRDERCGQCAPVIQIAVASHLKKTKQTDALDVYRSSHLGGHRFAGVVVCYPSGNWYGRISADDVPGLVNAELRLKEPLVERWRGRMGLTPELQMDSIFEMMNRPQPPHKRTNGGRRESPDYN